MDIKKAGGLPPPQPESALSINKSGAAPRPPVSPPIPATPARPVWQSGQILQALVLKASPEQMLLNIQGIQTRIARPPALPLHSGDRLQLEVLKNTPELQLKLIDVQAATSTLSGRALRASLPRQQPMPPLLANIEYLSRNPEAANRFDRAVRTAAQQVYYQLPSVESLRKPGALKQALELSGVFLEHNLQTAANRTSPSNIQQDTRTSLLRLSTQLQYYIARETRPRETGRAPLPPANIDPRPAPGGAAASSPVSPRHTAPAVSAANPSSQAAVSASLAQNASPKAAEQLLQQIDGVLARLQIHQLHQLKSEESFRPGWSIELPVRSEQGINLFDIRIQRENLPLPWSEEDAQQRQQQAAQQWSVRLAFDLEGLGPVQVVIALQQEQISVHFHAEQAQTSTLFNDHLDMLGSRLRHAGLDVAGIDCRQGTPEPAAEIISTPLVDEQA